MSLKKPFRRVVAAVHQTPWAILPSKLKEIVSVLDLRTQGVRLSREQIQERLGSQRSQPVASRGRVSVLNIYGTISPRLSAMQDVSGGTSAEAISRAFTAAVNDPDVSAIILNIDSPGGAVGGIAELSQKIFEARGKKPIKAFANGQMASAAYWIGSAADEIIATPSATDIGSVGVLTIVEDDTKAMEKIGIERTVIASSEFKGEGWKAMSEDYATHLQTRVDALHKTFVADLARNRGTSIARVESDFGKGRTFLAADAVAGGLVDRVGTLESVLKELGASGSSSNEQATAPTSPQKGETMSTKVETDKTTETATSPTIPLVSMGDISAQVMLTALPADQKLELITSLSKEAATLTHSALLDRVNAFVTEKKPAVGGVPTIQNGAAEADKFQAQARDAILVRTWGANDLPDTVYDIKTQDQVSFRPNKRDYQISSLPRLAEQCLIRAGIPVAQVQRLAVADIARIVMGADLRQFGIVAEAGAYNVTGMFSNIFYDATNVLLRRSYTEANTTFQAWMKQGQSLTDFKPVYKVIAGELSDPKAIPEDGEFEETTITDGKESYRLTVWGEVWSQSWQSVVNDQLSAFTEIPAKQGRAMKRKQNKLAYGVLKDNAALGNDGLALFEANTLATPGHNNITTGANPPSVATLNVMTGKMMTMTGLNVAERTTLNLMPKWLLAGPLLRGTVLELLGSTSNPASSNSNVKNIWENGLTPILDAELGLAAGGSDVAYYLAADKNDVDTVEYAYLQGLETPAYDSMMTFDRLGMKQRVYQAFAVKALDFRGLQKHNGA